jgi:hypothetical protein
MEKFISERFAINGLLTILSLIVIFHMLVIIGIIPFEIIWGGRLKDSSQMLTFETASLTINLIMLVTVLIKAGFLKFSFNQKIIMIVFWIMFIIFFINTIGNILSKNEFEKIVFTPLTLILSIFSFRLTIGKKKDYPLDRFNSKIQ